MRLALSLAAFMLLAGTALAEKASAESAIVPTKNIDMSDTTQVAKLHQAVVKTAEALCKKDRLEGRELKDCIKATTDAAIKGNPSGELKAFHASLSVSDRYSLAAN